MCLKIKNAACIFSDKQSVKVLNEIVGKNSSLVSKAEILKIRQDTLSPGVEVNNDQDHELGLLLDSKFNSKVYRLLSLSDRILSFDSINKANSRETYKAGKLSHK
ncbi:hypothetical protein GCM10023091_00150 [Ravibacter arvi]|uniref:Uncharacterized protein n=1 Tax=Ravibacter arvi TaxID=2051041 RepID=A0ABP8LKT1_9BACT